MAVTFIKFIFLLALVLMSFGLTDSSILLYKESSRTYPVGFNTIHQTSKKGYPILISTWYPAIAGKEKMDWSDYIKIGGAEVNRDENKLLQEFKETIAIKWVMGIDIPEQTFVESINKQTNSSLATRIVAGRFPLIIALAAPMDYAESFEFLASRGFVIAAIDGVFPNDSLSDQSPQFFVKYTDLLEELLDQMASKIYVKQNDISVFGHGFGIQPAMYLAMRNSKIKKVVNFDGGFFGPRSKSTISIDYRPQNLQIPLLHIITRDQQNEEDKNQFGAMSNLITRVSIKPDFFRHHDLSIFGRFTTHTAMVRGDKTETINKIFADIHQITLAFLINEAFIPNDTSTLLIEKFNY